MQLNNSLGYLLNISARLMKRELDKLLKKYDITTTQWSVLKVLSQENHLTQAEIAERLNADRATAGTVLDKLIKKNYIAKTLRVDDRRSYCVELLPETQKLVNEMSTMAMTANLKAVEGLSEDEIQSLVENLKTIIGNLGVEDYDLEI